MLALLMVAWRFLLIAVIYAFLWRLAREVMAGVTGTSVHFHSENASDHIRTWRGAGREGIAGEESGPRIVVISTSGDPPAGATFFLADRMVIGRAPDCDIVIKDIFASWRHAILYRKGRKFFIEDNGSKNGTLVNGRRLRRRTILKPGDQLLIGDTMLELKE
ncbi:MAG: FHA domain-containing protein [Firmicutes bacterium]|nr:FHA domain-containing protein [Bacillota bacterium]